MSAYLLAVERLWNGDPAPGGVGAEVHLEPLAGGALALRARAWLPGPPRVPDAPAGTRVDGLWEFDVVECFLAGAGGRYLEVELGAAGHWLALDFAGPRVRTHAYEDLSLRVSWQALEDGFAASVVLPREILPPKLEAANAFAVLGVSFLAHHPVPGGAPDFHQPGSFPPISLS